MFGLSTKPTEDNAEAKRKSIVDTVMKREAADSIVEGYEAEIAEKREVANRSKREAELALASAAEAKAEEEKEAKRLAVTKDQHTALQGELAELTKKRDTTMSEVVLEDKKLTDLKAERKVEADKLTEVQTYLADLAQVQSDEAAKFKSDCNHYDAETTKRKAELEKVETDLKLAVSRSAARIAKLDEEIADQAKVIEDLTTKRLKLEDTITKLESTKTALEASVEKLNATIETLKAAKVAAETATKEAEATQVATEAKLAELQAEVKRIEEMKFALSDRTRVLDEREALIQENFIRAGVPYPKK